MAHLTEKDRYYIEKALSRKEPIRQIAEALGFSRSAIYREIGRGTFMRTGTDLSVEPSYAWDVGQRVRDERARRKGRKKKLLPDDPYLGRVGEYIAGGRCSPWAARVRIGDNKVCTKTLYNYIHSGYIPGLDVFSLPYARPRKKKAPKPARRPFPRGRSIGERPSEVQGRGTYGHWEMDTVYSSRGTRCCLLVLSERMTREELLFRMGDRTSASVVGALDRLERSIGTPAFRAKFKTITCDNGVEFADWESMERSCRARGKRTAVYFCHPYSSWERGTNENANRMVRRCIPKGDDIGLYSPREVRAFQDWMNGYPRAIFGGMSSREYREFLRLPGEPS